MISNQFYDIKKLSGVLHHNSGSGLITNHKNYIVFPAITISNASSDKQIITLKINKLTFMFRDNNSGTQGNRWDYIPSQIFWKIEKKTNIIAPIFEKTTEGNGNPKFHGSLDLIAATNIPGITGWSAVYDYYFQENKAPKTILLPYCSSFSSTTMDLDFAISFWMTKNKPNSGNFATTATTGTTNFSDTPVAGFYGVDLSSYAALTSSFYSSLYTEVWIEYEIC